jgi:transcription-repair coupling factor (superfamily II helicase)
MSSSKTLRRAAPSPAAFGAGLHWQTEFGGRLPYEDATTCSAAIAEIKRIWIPRAEGPVLLCGDVAYGKRVRICAR